MMLRIVTIACAASIAAGCSSTPELHYYTLDLESSNRAEAPCTVEVDRFRVAEPLNRAQILIRAAPTRIEYYAVDEWAGSLGEMVARKLAAELGGGDPGEAEISLTGTVLECGQLDRAGGADARLDLQVIAVSPDGAALMDRRYQATRSATSATAEAVVEALSRAAEDLAVEIAEDLEVVCGGV